MAKTTIADVARLADVSASSVSNLLNGRSQRMRPATQERIENAIEALGFTPSLAARQLKTGHSPFIGLIVPSVADPFFGSFARYVEQAASEKGYQVLLGNSDRNSERERKYAEMLWGSGVRGIIFGSSLVKFDHLANLYQEGMHFVSFYRSTRTGDQFIADSIGVDNIQATRLLTKHLLALGHRRIGFVSGPTDMICRLDRLEGYYKTLDESDISIDQQLVWEEASANPDSTSFIELGRQGAHHLLSLPEPPSAIIAINDMHAFGVYAGARDLGVKIPDDLSVAGVDDIMLSAVSVIPLTTIKQPIRDIARLSVKRIIDRLENDRAQEPVHLMLPSSLIVRESTTRFTGRLASQLKF
jgi:DNA-binding LacI/PurR family transcriptional regulator